MLNQVLLCNLRSQHTVASTQVASLIPAAFTQELPRSLCSEVVACDTLTAAIFASLCAAAGPAQGRTPRQTWRCKLHSRRPCARLGCSCRWVCSCSKTPTQQRLPVSDRWALKQSHRCHPPRALPPLCSLLISTPTPRSFAAIWSGGAVLGGTASPTLQLRCCTALPFHR